MGKGDNAVEGVTNEIVELDKAPTRKCGQMIGKGKVVRRLSRSR
jgi:hypothetical protein